MTRTAFVSGADHNYFPMLLEWVHCMRALPQAVGASLCILDAGLTTAQIETLRPLVTSIHRPDWPCDIPARKIRGREYLKSCICRPFINSYFPGYDVYFWMDADTWVQNAASIDMFLAGAARGKIALTGQVDRAYPRQIRVKWLGRWPWKIRGFYYSNAVRAFGFRTAKALMPYHVLLAGAFALHRDAPHWQRWQELVIRAARRGKIFTAEQLTLGILCYIEGYAYEILPAYTHWLCQFKPFYNNEIKKFVEPFIPHNEIGILHLSGYDEMRLDRSLKTDFATLDGSCISLSYRYPYFDGVRDMPVASEDSAP